MISNISKWVGSVVIAVIIVTILEMLLPEGKNKKYIKTVMGVYILFTVISPIVKAVSGNSIDIDSLVETQNMVSASNIISMQTSSSIENVYLANVKKDISVKLEQKGYITTSISLQIETSDEQNYGKIYQMDLRIRKSTKSEHNKIFKKVETVEISIGDTGLKKELSSENTITEEEMKYLKEYLSTIYDVQVEKILIKEAK